MNYDVLAAIIFIIFAALMTFESIKLGLGTINDPGPGFLPFFSILMLGILSLIHLFSQVRKSKTHRGLEFKLGPYWVKALSSIAFSFFYVLFLWNKLGYIVGSTLWLVAMFRIGGVQSWKKSLLITIITIITSYFLLQKLAKTSLPKGIFGF